MKTEGDIISMDKSRSIKMRRENLRIQIDQLLEKDIKAVNSQEGSSLLQHLDIRKRNPLLLEYIHSNYQKYHIQNPFHNQLHYISPILPPNPSNQQTRPTPTNRQKIKLTLSYQQSSNSSGLFTPKRQLNIQKYRQFSTTIHKKDKEKQQEADQIAQFQENYIPEEKSFQIKHDKSSKFHQKYFEFETVNTLSDEHVKTLNDERLKTQNDEHLRTQSLKQSQLIKIFENVDDWSNSNKQERYQLDESVKQRYKNNIQKYQSNKSQNNKQNQHEMKSSFQISESFRYCIGCERAILEINQEIHQRTCRQFQTVFAMNLNDTLSYLQHKISSIENQIKQQQSQISQSTIEGLDNYSSKMVEESRLISRSGQMTERFEDSYEQSINISQRLCQVTQEINKLNWFLRIRSIIKKNFDC